jgi:hypothetical protein
MVDTARGMMPMPLFGSDGSASRSTPVMVWVLPEEVWPYARIVQLKPSTKREMRGSALAVNISCWVAGGPCTRSKEKTCFFAAAAAEAAEAGGAAPPVGGPVALSTETWFEEVAWITERWKRAGMEDESWFVGGRIRRAGIKH